MSDALDYLKQVRPGPVEAYMSFLKQSGEHLDPKTRFLISVITKVDKQTKTGFKQYLKRALKEGNSPDEILDALLVAFPTLGLSKILWAIEQIIDMDIEEFRLETDENKQDWHQVGEISKIQTGIELRTIDKKQIFIFNNNNNFKIYDSQCPHNRTPLSMEHVQGDTITCPKHGWGFKLNSGKCFKNGDTDLIEYDIKIENDLLYAYW